ncbi:hypothetical protein DFAR_630021 [Desulfarculales bacterium]
MAALHQLGLPYRSLTLSLLVMVLNGSAFYKVEAISFLVFRR